MVKAFAGNNETQSIFICSYCLENEVKEEWELCDKCAKERAEIEDQKEQKTKEIFNENI